MKGKLAKKPVSHERDAEGLKDSLKSIPTGVADSFTQMGKDSMSDLWAQFFGAEKKSSSHGEIHQGEEFNLGNAKHADSSFEEEALKHYAEPALNYRDEILRGSEKITKSEEREMQYQIQEILVEIKQLAAASEELQVQFREVVSDQRITKPGKYHVGFFKFIITLLRQARKKVENSNSFLAALHSKKKQRGYWAMFKKHGTSFGMSNERNVSTQTG